MTIWTSVENGLPEHGELVLCEFEEGVLDCQFPINDGFMVERWSELNPVDGVKRWASINKLGLIDELTLDDLRMMEAIKFSTNEQLRKES